VFNIVSQSGAIGIPSGWEEVVAFSSHEVTTGNTWANVLKDRWKWTDISSESYWVFRHDWTILPDFPAVSGGGVVYA
jgi:hypothetical protein